LYCIVLASDLADGRIARQRQQVSSLGTLLDHGSDAVFVTGLCAAGAWLGLLPLPLPFLIAAAFIQYSLDSRGNAPRGSRLGRWNGIAYYVIVGALIAVRHVAVFEGLHYVLYGGGWLLVVATLASMIERAGYTLRTPPSG
jgi:phosphatidylglycerophosphate synthase